MKALLALAALGMTALVAYSLGRHHLLGDCCDYCPSSAPDEYEPQYDPRPSAFLDPNVESRRVTRQEAVDYLNAPW